NPCLPPTRLLSRLTRRSAEGAARCAVSTVRGSPLRVPSAGARGGCRPPGTGRDPSPASGVREAGGRPVRTW
ncbi:hypothetical protein, partial [Actinomadura rubrisoli]|uniref:hypothetical protein n=1 Tax=Actinomadura rubrisoli TaxID=2530368 RepID=UPI001A9EAD62